MPGEQEAPDRQDQPPWQDLIVPGDQPADIGQAAEQEQWGDPRDARVVDAELERNPLLEREEAERAAWAAPGVTEVEDRLAVIP